MGFRFKYKSILKYREDIEKNAKNELALAVQAREQAKQKLKRLERERFCYLKQREADLQKGLSAASFSNYNSGMAYFKIAIEQTIEEIYSAEKVVEQARLKLKDATQEKKKMEKLKERALDAFKAEELRLESLLVDGLVTYKTATKH